MCCVSLFTLAVSGVAHPGELLAVMGSSGAGKTTLLNTLMIRSPKSLQVSGQRALNGVPVSPNTLAKLSAYVQQDDLFIGTLTVREHLIFQVFAICTLSVRLAANVGRDERAGCPGHIVHRPSY